MRKPLPDSELLSQLCTFMQSVPLLWSQEQLIALHSSGRVHAEFRGNESSPLSFDLEVLENEITKGAGYLNLMVSVSDSSRLKGARGSSWRPLTASIIWRASGEIEMPLPWQISQETFGDVG